MDTTFGTTLGVAGGVVLTMKFEPDASVWVEGSFSTVGGVNCTAVAYLNASGGVFSVDVLADGRVILGGQFSTIHGVRQHGVARLKIEITETYRVGRLNSAGYVPAIGTNGSTPSYVNGGLIATCTNALNQRLSLLFHGSTAIAIPFQGGTLCVAQSVPRTVVQSSGGSVSGNDRLGTHAHGFTTAEFNAAAPLPGDIVFCQ